MKIAVCYSGLVRHLFDVIESHKKHLLNLYDCDVYFHFWDIIGNTQIGWCEITKVNRTDVMDYDTQNKIVCALKPKQFEFESLNNKYQSLLDLVKKYHPEFNIEVKPYEFTFNPINTVSMYYSIERSHSLMENTKQTYDAVIRIRSDLLFMEDVIIPPINKKLTVPNVVNHPVNDQFAIGDMETMKIYASMFSEIIDKQNNPTEIHQWGQLHPEGLLTYRLHKFNIDVVRSDAIQYKMARYCKVNGIKFDTLPL